jgi:hypothetical protein
MHKRAGTISSCRRTALLMLCHFLLGDHSTGSVDRVVTYHDPRTTCDRVGRVGLSRCIRCRAITELYGGEYVTKVFIILECVTVQ